MMTNFWTLLKAEFRFSLDWNTCVRQLMILIFGFISGVTAFFEPSVIFTLAPAIAFYQLFIRFQWNIMFDSGSKDRTAAAYLYYKAKEVIFAKLIIEILWTFITLFIMSIVILIIASINSLPNIGENFLNTIEVVIGVLSIYIIISILVQFGTSAVNTVMSKRVVGIAIVTFAITPFLVMPYILTYVPSYASFIFNDVTIWHWFIPFFNYVLVSSPGVANSYMMMIPLIYSLLFLASIIPLLAEKTKKSQAM